MRGVTYVANVVTPECIFLLTRLMRGVTCYKSILLRAIIFLLTRLMRGVTKLNINKGIICEFLLTRLMRGVTRVGLRHKVIGQISTHTPHARRDFSQKGHGAGHWYFYSHASCEAWLVAHRGNRSCKLISTHTPHARRDRKIYIFLLSHPNI